jgi:hypothetical protein
MTPDQNSWIFERFVGSLWDADDANDDGDAAVNDIRRIADADREAWSVLDRLKDSAEGFSKASRRRRSPARIAADLATLFRKHADRGQPFPRGPVDVDQAAALLMDLYAADRGRRTDVDAWRRRRRSLVDVYALLARRLQRRRRDRRRIDGVPPGDDATRLAARGRATLHERIDAVFERLRLK